MVTLRGLAGSSPPVDVGAVGSYGMYTAGTCRAGLSTFYSGPRRVFFLSLGDDAPLGGTLTVTTCGLTANNTVLYAGLGCPKWDVPFQCQAGSDDSGDAAGQAPCASNPRASTVTLRAVASRGYFLQVGGFDGAAVTSGLQWEYAPPAGGASLSPTKTRAATGTRTRSASARPPSRTRSTSPSRSRSRKPKVV